MPTPMIGEIYAWPTDHTPQGWLRCEGQSVSRNQYSELFEVLGTLYGGDGDPSFNLPDLRGRVPVGSGQGVGLSKYSVGDKMGSESVALSADNLPKHQHLVHATTDAANTGDPTNGLLAEFDVDAYATGAEDDVVMDSDTIAETGGSGHDPSVMQPYLSLHYIIAYQGLFPPKN